MKNTEVLVMEIQFEHVLNSDKQLGIALANSKRRDELLLPVVRELLTAKGIGAEEVLYRNVSLRFLCIPTCITPLKVYFQSKRLIKTVKNIFEDNRYIRTLSDLTIALLLGFLEDFYYMHTEEMVSYNGEFELSDMAVVNNCQYRITKKPTISFDIANISVSQWKRARLNDVRKLVKIFTNMLDRRPVNQRIGEPAADDLPLFYFKFIQEIQGVTEDEITTVWFWEFILNNPVLKEPQIRHSFVSAIFLVLKTPMSTQLQRSEEYEAIHKVFSRRPDYDWRYDMAQTRVPVLRKTYRHGEDEEGPTVDAFDGGPWHRVDAFPLSYWGTLKLDRNLGQHAGDNSGMDIISVPDIEVFGSSKFGDYLSGMVKDFVSTRLNRRERFTTVWSAYVSSRVRTTDGKKAEPGKRLAFW